MATHRLFDSLGSAFLRELGGVYADDDNAIREAGFDLPQLRKHVQAVNSTECPEVEQDDLAP
jgi:hypothetical protein